MSLANQIKNYYFEHIQELSPDKRFHFASRLAAWEGEDRFYDILRECRGDLLPDNDKQIIKVVDELLTKPQTGTRNAHERRQLYFDRYPSLWGIHLALFRLRHWMFVYGYDGRSVFEKFVSKSELKKLCSNILADDDATRNLSTFAINTMYLTRVLYEESNFDPGQFINIASKYNTNDKTDIQLLIYLYTHCIIGASNFYVSSVPQTERQTYTAMLEELEPVIESNYTNINLDNKLEFLVCCRIVDFESSLYAQIYSECNSSISEKGTFIIDKLNSNKQKNRASFNKSEHRNVLYLMSVSRYSPHSTLV